MYYSELSEYKLPVRQKIQNLLPKPIKFRPRIGFEKKDSIQKFNCKLTLKLLQFNFDPNCNIQESIFLNTKLKS